MANIQFNLRVPEELKQKIDEASAKSGRSINAEATYRLEQSFTNPPQSYTDGNVFMNFIEALLQNAPKDKTSEVLTLLVKAWREENKKPTN